MSVEESLRNDISFEGYVRELFDASMQSTLDTVSSKTDFNEFHINTVEENLSLFIISAISTEHSHHVDGDFSLETSINAEASSREDADNRLSAEISECCSIHTSVDVVLSGEIIRGFGSIETTVSTKESMTVVRENSIDSKLSSAISSEASSRVSKDDSLESVISEAKTSINTVMTAEASSRVAGDLSLENAIAREEGRIDAILDGSTVDLDQFAEIVSFVNGIDLENDNALLSAVTSIGTAIGSEESSRVSKDNSLESVIATNRTDANTAMSTEISNRQSADTSLFVQLNDKINNEISDRTADVDAEQARAEGAEGMLNTKINTEITNRENADTSLNTAINEAVLMLNTKINDETSRAQGAEGSLEAALSSEVANLLSNTDLTAIDSFSEVVTELDAVKNIISNTYFKKVSISGLVNGTNKNFTLGATVKTGSEAIYYNGLLQEMGEDYTISGGVNVQFTYTPAIGGKVTAYGVYA
jgi:hypothetical protein